MRNASKLVPALSFVLTFSTVAYAQIDQQINPPPTEEALAQEVPTYGLSVEYFRYEDRIYSQSRKTAIGEQVDIDTAFKYQFGADTFSRFRFEIDPQEDTLEGKTSKFEILFNHTSGPFVGQLDLDVKSNDVETGGISIGPDIDSEGTFISYQSSPAFRFNFYPYNFDGEVGDEFNTWDVTRIYSITGSPRIIEEVQVDSERLEARTIPGIGLDLFLSPELRFSAGFGVATYLYPSDPDFDIVDNPSATTWERREDTGWRASLAYQSEILSTVVEHVTHDKADETGSLLKEASAFRLSLRVRPLLVETEVVRSVAGERPYDVNESGQWFENELGYRPIYTDYNNTGLQDWLGREGYGALLRVGAGTSEFVPYFSYKWQSEYFVYRDLESAHLLRTNDDFRSHGGLHRVGLGAYFYTGGLEIQPEIEWLQAKNEVFGSSGSVRQDRINADLTDTDILATITIKYAFDQLGEARY